jgi:hypothetical protein
LKIHIITIHHIHNFGSVFQAYCLQKYLSDIGEEVDIIDYRPPYYQAGRNKLKSVVGRLLNARAYLSRKRKYDEVLSQYERLSNRQYTTIEQLKASYGNSQECFIAGGDQLWNSFHPCGNDEAYKLTFTNSPNKLAIGTSMVRNNQTREELQELAKKVKTFKAILLREKSTVQRFSNFTEVPCKHIIDPVGLADQNHLRDIAVNPAMKDRYAVMYLADSGLELDACVKKLSLEMNLKIVHLCGFRKKCYCDVFEKDTGPKELLGYILNADFVLSASFHATMFSIIFNKQFATLLPNAQTNERIESLLDFFGLENRIIRNPNDADCLNELIDFMPVNVKLEELRQESRNEIRRVLNLCGV